MDFHCLSHGEFVQWTSAENILFFNLNLAILYGMRHRTSLGGL